MQSLLMWKRLFRRKQPFSMGESRMSILPEAVEQCGEGGGIADEAEGMAEVRGNHGAVEGLAEAVVDEQEDAFVLLGADDAACRLPDAVHARIEIGVLSAAIAFFVIIGGARFALNGGGGQTDADDDTADEAVAREVDRLGKDAAHDGEADGGCRRIAPEAVEKGFSVLVAHAARLGDGLQLGGGAPDLLFKCIEIVK